MPVKMKTIIIYKHWLCKENFVYVIYIRSARTESVVEWLLFVKIIAGIAACLKREKNAWDKMDGTIWCEQFDETKALNLIVENIWSISKGMSFNKTSE